MAALNDGVRRLDRASQWTSRLAVFTVGLLLFETVSGLSIYLLPFSVPNQVMVLIHTAGGLVWTIGFIVYQLKHWLTYRRYTMTHVKLTGYIGLATIALCGLSGLILAWQAAFGRQISTFMDLTHIVTTFAIIAFVVPHIVLVVIRDRRTRNNPTVEMAVRGAKSHGLGVVIITAIGFFVIILSVAAHTPVKYTNAFPAEYGMPFGPQKPFAPSLASTASGGAYDSRSLSDSKSCGQTGCHEDIYHEWEVSAHRWSSMDPAFQGIQNVMAKQNGPESTRYCGGCHDPISLFSGAKNIFAANLTNLAGYNEGVSCIVCHAIKQTDIKGNANYTMTQPRRYMFEGSDAPMARFAGNFLIRAYPKFHNSTFNHRMFKSPKFCAACHKQFIDKEVNKVGWVQLQNQYDNWRKSRWNHEGQPRKTIECRECHMPLQHSVKDTLARAPGDYNRAPFDSYHRSHRFLGANQFIPNMLKLPGAQQQTDLTEKWLRGDIEIPEIAHKWKTGPAVPITINAPAEVSPGGKIDLTVNINSNKVGHDFPTGPLDIIQAWLEVTATDDTGKTVYATGRLDDRHFVEKGSFIFRAEPVDQYGNLIERHNLWEMVGVRYKRSLFPGFWDHVPFTFQCPADVGAAPPYPARQNFRLNIPKGAAGRLHLTAKLRYRKIGQFLVNFVFGEKKNYTCPVTDLSSAKLDIALAPNRTRVAKR